MIYGSLHALAPLLFLSCNSDTGPQTPDLNDMFLSSAAPPGLFEMRKGLNDFRPPVPFDRSFHSCLQRRLCLPAEILMGLAWIKKNGKRVIRASGRTSTGSSNTMPIASRVASKSDLMEQSLLSKRDSTPLFPFRPGP